MAFSARWNSTCPGCDEQIHRGDMVTLVDSDRGRVTVHDSCAEDGLVTTSRTTPPSDVLPRGKTAKDRCDRCFLVHSSTQVGCE